MDSFPLLHFSSGAVSVTRSMAQHQKGPHWDAPARHRPLVTWPLNNKHEWPVCSADILENVSLAAADSNQKPYKSGLILNIFNCLTEELQIYWITDTNYEFILH